MKNLSIFDRKFLASCNVRAEGRRRWSDVVFLRSCGISPEGFRDANTHRDISNCRGCGARTYEQHAQNCPHEALDGTQQTLAECGLDPYNRGDYLMLGFAGNPPAELDGEIEEMLPDGIRLEDSDEDGEED